MVDDGQWVDIGAVLAKQPGEAKPKKKSKALTAKTKPILARVAGEIIIEDRQLVIKYEEKEAREYVVPAATHIRVQSGEKVEAGQQLTDGSVNPQDMLHIRGKEAVQRYLVDEVQKVYRSQGVNINDKHIEVIAHQMLTKVCIDSSGDTELVPGELVSRFHYEDVNAKVLAEGGEPATAHVVLLGITRASLSTDSWLAAASFQETTRVLTEAAVSGKVDRLSGLKENVIIGKLIPAHYEVAEEVPELPVGEEGEAGEAELPVGEEAEAKASETELPTSEAEPPAAEEAEAKASEAELPTGETEPPAAEEAEAKVSEAELPTGEAEPPAAEEEAPAGEEESPAGEEKKDEESQAG